MSSEAKKIILKTEICSTEVEDLYVLSFDGVEVATGSIMELAKLVSEAKIRTKCSLFGPSAYNPKLPFKKPAQCEHSDCSHCGWNPEVSAKRTQRIRARLNMEG